MIERNEEFTNYIDTVLNSGNLSWSKYPNILAVPEGMRTRFFSKNDPSYVEPPDSLKHWFDERAGMLLQSVRDQFPDFPNKFTLDSTNINTMIAIFTKHCIQDAQELRESLDVWLDKFKPDIETKELCIRDLSMACLLQIGIVCRVKKLAEFITADQQVRDQLSLFNQLLLLTGKIPINDLSQLSSSSDSTCKWIFDNMTSQDKDKLINQKLININQQKIVSNFIKEAEKLIPILGDRRDLLKQITKSAKNMDNFGKTCHLIDQLLNKAREKKDKKLINLCYEFISENSPKQVSTMTSSFIFAHPNVLHPVDQGSKDNKDIKPTNQLRSSKK